MPIFLSNRKEKSAFLAMSAYARTVYTRTLWDLRPAEQNPLYFAATVLAMQDANALSVKALVDCRALCERRVRDLD